MKLRIYIKQGQNKIVSLFISPRSNETDKYRKEYILNVLLLALAVAAIVALLIFIFHALSGGINNASILPTLFFTTITFSLIFASRKGHTKVASYLFLLLLSLAAAQLLIQWSFELPQTSLLFALVIVIAGILLSARATLYASALVGLLIIIVGREQTTHVLHPNLSWIKQSFTIGDAISYSGVLIVIGIVSWLSNREIDKSLSRARQSEAALAVERDSLEDKVIERTKELKQNQLIRTIELQKFAEFGRINANLLHEISNPLTAASLNLEQIREQESDIVIRVQANLTQLKRYIVLARNQLESQDTVEYFNVEKEIEQALMFLRPIAEKSKIIIDVNCQDIYKIYGNPIKFNQIVSNIVSNAVDSFESLKLEPTKHITIQSKLVEDMLIISISNNGKMIEKKLKDKIFDPFFTTKNIDHKGLGIGLSLVKQFVEEDFDGTIEVTSSNQITTFTLNLKIYKDQYFQS